MQEAGIFRPELPIDSNFTIIPNAWLRDGSLSAGAKVLLFYLLSHQVGYEIRDPQILKESGLGRHALRSARDELVKAGWLVLSRIKNEDNTLGTYRYELVEARGYFSPVEDSSVEHSPDENRPHLRRPLEEKTISKKTIEERARTIPDDWAPKDDIYALAKYEVLDIEKEAESFMLFHTAKGTKYKNWDAAFRKWLNKGLDFHAEKHYKESERDLEKRRLDEWLASQMEDDSE